MVTMSASQLLIIDVQVGFINEGTAHVPARVDALQASFDRVSATRLYNPQKSLFRKLTGWSAFPLGAAETQLAFTPRRDTVIIDKSTYSCVNETLIETLRHDGIGRVHLCGVATEAAVLVSAVDLFDAGIEPVVLAHACGSPGGHELSGLKLLRRLIGAKQVMGS
jgi:nicotinamidase-related amidase